MTELTGKRGDRIIVDDPHAKQPEFVRWEPTRDARVRADHAAFPPAPALFDAVEPPRSLGKFSCRGDYVYPPGSILGNEQAVIILSQSGGQIADLFEPMHVQIAKSFAVPPALMFESSPCVAFSHEIEKRRALLSERVNEAMLRPGFSFPDHAFGGPALDRFLAGSSGNAVTPDINLPISRRRRRRLRGRAKALRR